MILKNSLIVLVGVCGLVSAVDSMPLANQGQELEKQSRRSFQDLQQYEKRMSETGTFLQKNPASSLSVMSTEECDRSVPSGIGASLNSISSLTAPMIGPMTELQSLLGSSRLSLEATLLAETASVDAVTEMKKLLSLHREIESKKRKDSFEKRFEQIRREMLEVMLQL